MRITVFFVICFCLSSLSYSQNKFTQSFYQSENFEIEIDVAPKVTIPAKQVFLVPEDETAEEFASTILNSFAKYHDVYIVDNKDLAKSLKKHDQALAVKLKTVARETQETSSEVESREHQSQGNYGYTSYNSQHASEKRTSTEQSTSVRLKLSVQVTDKNGKVVHSEDFSVAETYETNEVAAVGQAFESLEHQIQEAFLPKKETYVFPYVTDPKYGLNLGWPPLVNGQYDLALQMANKVIENTRKQQETLMAEDSKKSTKKAKKWRLREARALYNLGIVYAALGKFDQAQSFLSDASMMYQQGFIQDALEMVPAIRQKKEAFQAYLELVNGPTQKES